MSSPWKDFPDDTPPLPERRKYPPEVLPDVDHLLDREFTVMPGFEAKPIWESPPQNFGPGWPPLSREQVVELHEALIEFLSMMEHGYGGPNEEQADAATAARRLEPKLLDLGLGMLPTQKPRRWTDDDIRAALEEPTGTLVTSPLGVRHNCWTCRLNLKGVGAWGCGSQEMDTVEWLSQMANELLPQDDGSRMPSKLSDRCPGWEAKP